MSQHMSRRTVLRSAAVAAAAGPLIGGRPAAAARQAPSRTPPAVRELEEKIRELMARHRVPGVALGVRYRGVDYVRGFGVTDVSNPVPVDGDTVFRVASTTKTFTGTAVMRLVERGRLDLDRRVRHYLPDFRVADEAASARVTVRQLLDHSAGWRGDFFLDTGDGDDALARYVAAMSRLPQLTAPGRVFSYNNAALTLAGRLIEVAARTSYERAIDSLLLKPLGLRHSAFTLAGLPGVSWAVPHVHDEAGVQHPVPELWDSLPRSINAAGGLISSARDQLRWARYHLGDGSPLLSRRSLRAMRSRPGPGGTLYVEIDGFGVTWMVRQTAEGPRILQHGGDWDGQHSGFLIVPERDVALTVLTNSLTGSDLTTELFASDRALSRLAGLHNVPAVPRALPAAELAAYPGQYTASQIGLTGEERAQTFDITPADGQLRVAIDGRDALRLVFYRRDYVLVRNAAGDDLHFRAQFLRGRDGSIEWLRFGGRLYRRGAVAATLSAGTGTMSRPGTLPHPSRY